jgi:hypothetical protein
MHLRCQRVSRSDIGPTSSPARAARSSSLPPGPGARWRCAVAVRARVSSRGLSPLANAEGPTAVLLTGGSAFGLAAADGAVRWLELRGLGRPTPVGVIPLVPAAVVFDLAEGEPGRRPGPQEGYAACEAAARGVPRRGRIGAGAGAALGKVLGRGRQRLGRRDRGGRRGPGRPARRPRPAAPKRRADPGHAAATRLGHTPRSEHDARLRLHRRHARQARLRRRRANRERRIARAVDPAGPA